MKKRLLALAVLMFAISALCAFAGCTDESGSDNMDDADGHVHVFDRQEAETKYMKSEADCTHKAVYYYSCSCGETGTETFESGELGAHNYESGICLTCGQSDPSFKRKTVTEEEWKNALDTTKLDDCEIIEYAFGIPNTHESYGQGILKLKGNTAYLAACNFEIGTEPPYEIVTEPPYEIDEEFYYEDRTSQEAIDSVYCFCDFLINLYDKFTYDEQNEIYVWECTEAVSVELEGRLDAGTEWDPGDTVTVEFENGKPVRIYCNFKSTGSKEKPEEEGVLNLFKFGDIEITLPE